MSHGKKEKPPVPDFTQGGGKDESHDWNLGATGNSERGQRGGSPCSYSVGLDVVEISVTYFFKKNDTWFYSHYKVYEARILNE